MTRIALAWLELLLRLHPREFRDRYGAAASEMLLARTAAVEGGWTRLRFVLRESAGLTVSAIREWARVWRPARGGEGMVREMAGAVRRLARAPGFTLASVGMLALGIGATMSVYTLLHRVVLRPLPFEEPDRLVWLEHRAPGWGLDFGIGSTAWLYAHYDGSSRLLESAALAQPRSATLVDPASTAERLRIAVVTASAAPMFGVTPLLGRWFSTDGDPASAVLSEGLWRRRFGADPSVLGRSVRLDDASYEIVGVMPSRFTFPASNTEAWIHQEFPISHRDRGFNYVAAGRMVAGTTIESLRAELRSLVASAPEAPGVPDGAAGMVSAGGLVADPIAFEDHVIGGLRSTLWVLLGGVAVLLAAAWANVANLFLVRAETRRREVAVRRALGAGRVAIVRFFLAEATVVGLFSGLLGLGLAWAVVRTVAGVTWLHLPRAEEIAVDPHVATIALGLALITALFLTLMPVLHRDGDAMTALRDGGRGRTAGRRVLRTRGVLMAGQVALALTLVSGAGLLLRSWSHARNTGPGFAATDLLLVEVALPESAYTTREAQRNFLAQVMTRVASLPRVSGVALTTCPPLDGYCHGESVTAEDGATKPDEPPPIVSMRRVSPDFFTTLQLPILNGRGFTPQDHAGAADVVVLGAETARRLFPDRDPIGRRITPGDDSDPAAQWFTVVGIAADIPTGSVLDAARDPMLYLPLRDSRDDPRSVGLVPATLLVNTDADPAVLAPAIRGIIDDADATVAPSRIRTLDQVLAEDRATLSFATLLLVFAASMGLALSALGVYAVFAFSIGRRTPEFGLRIALGASASDIAGIVFRQAGAITIAGIVTGLAAAAAASRLLGSLLFGVSPLDPATLAAATLLLLATAAFAVAIPTRRAARMRPVEALRGEG